MNTNCQGRGVQTAWCDQPQLWGSSRPNIMGWLQSEEQDLPPLIRGEDTMFSPSTPTHKWDVRDVGSGPEERSKVLPSAVWFLWAVHVKSLFHDSELMFCEDESTPHTWNRNPESCIPDGNPPAAFPGVALLCTHSYRRHDIKWVLIFGKNHHVGYLAPLVKSKSPTWLNVLADAKLRANSVYCFQHSAGTTIRWRSWTFCKSSWSPPFPSKESQCFY